MKCYICDRDLSDPEVVYNNLLQAYEPCTSCLVIALEAAYTNGFTAEPEYAELEGAGNGEVEILDTDTDTDRDSLDEWISRAQIGDSD